MDSEPLLILAAYSVAIIAASLLGGWLPAMVRMTHTRTQLIMSFVAGLMLGVALYHLLPHALSELSQSGDVPVGGISPAAVDIAVWWVMIGMILMFSATRQFVS